jgi:hypothetical protein
MKSRRDMDLDLCFTNFSDRLAQWLENSISPVTCLAQLCSERRGLNSVVISRPRQGSDDAAV